MKAVVYREYAPDDNYAKILKVEDIDSPKPKPDEVVFTNKASALNYNDIWGMRGVPIAIPLPHISGSDVAGDVIAVGEDVQGFKVGDRVVSHSNLACRVCSACTAGREFDCTRRQVWGFQTGPLWGAYSEEVHLPEVNVSHIPEGVSYEDAAAAINDNFNIMAHVSWKSKNHSRSNRTCYGWWFWCWKFCNSNC